MATSTTYYSFNKPSGTDLVNPLVDTNPNWDIADSALHELNERSVATCTEVVSLGVHALSTLNTDTKFLKWIATANFTTGDTYTLNGVAVTAASPSGDALATGCIVAGAVVFACLNADNSAMTVFVSGSSVASDSERLGGELPSYYATDSDLDNAVSDITNMNTIIGNTSIVGIGDGTLTGAVSAFNTGKLDVDDYEITGVSNVKQTPTTGVDFVVPTDGYLYIALQDRVGAAASVSLKRTNNTYVALFNETNPTAAYNIRSVYIRKGTTIKVETLSYATVEYYPCTYA